MRLHTKIEYDTFSEKGESGLMLPKSDRKYGDNYIRTVNIWLVMDKVVEVSVWDTSGWKVHSASSTKRFETPEYALKAYLSEIEMWAT